MKAREEAKAKEGAPQRFWDGFQWVDRTPLVAAVGSAPAVTAQLALGNQKDRRVYVGNLPPGTTAEQVKEFGEFVSLMQ